MTFVDLSLLARIVRDYIGSYMLICLCLSRYRVYVLKSGSMPICAYIETVCI